MKIKRAGVISTHDQFGDIKPKGRAAPAHSRSFAADSRNLTLKHQRAERADGVC